MTDCIPVQQGDFYVCTRCGWGEGIMRTSYRGNCPIPLVPLSPELETLIADFKCDCTGRKVPRQVFRERAEHCDGCEHRQGVRCGTSEVLLTVVLAYKIHACPVETWPTLEPSESSTP